MPLYELNNFDRVLRFNGERIAHSSSRKGSDRDIIRWTEVDIYRTAGGSYVIHKIGKSRVYHAGPYMCSGTTGKLVQTNTLLTRRREEFRVTDLAPCPVCQPGPIQAHVSVTIEQDRGNTATSTTARGIVESAYNQDPEGVTYLTKTAKRALEEASSRDGAIRDAYLVETID